MEYIFAVVKVSVPLIDPQTRKQVGNDTKEFSKVFEANTQAIEIERWAKAQNANSCTLLFETASAPVPAPPPVAPGK